jgi:hypothetical protein
MISTKMKQWQKILMLLLPVFIFSSCNQNASEKKEAATVPDAVEKKRSEVMTIHDAIMPEMGTIMNLKKQLKEKAAAMDSTGSIYKEQLDSIYFSIEQLEAADEAMMQWMRTYKDPADSVSKEEAIEYLELKEEEILEVKEKMQESEATARALLNDH